MKLLRLTVYGVLLALLLAACSGDEAEAPSLTLRASPEAINEGESSTLTWDVTGTAPITLTLEPPPPNDVALTTPLEVSPSETTTYKLTATNAAGNQSREVTVTVNQRPRVMSFEVSSESVMQGRSITVSWETDSDDPVIATLTPSDTPNEPVTSPLTLSPTETTTYTLTLTNSAGSTTREFTVTVNPPATPTIDSLTTTPTAGDSLEVTFNWNLSSASACSLDPGDGSLVLTFEDCTATTEVRHTYTQAGDYSVTFNLPSGASQTLNITVSTANSPTNTPPSVNAGEDMNASINTSVTLAGQVSDPDGDALTLTWEIVSQPAGSNASLESVTTAEVTFTPDIPGQYVIKLTASDGSSVVSDDVTITARAETDVSPINTVYFLQDTNPTTLIEGQTQIITLERTGTTVEALTVYVQLGIGTTATADDYTITGAPLREGSYEVTFEALRSRTELTLAAAEDELEETNEQVVFTLLLDDSYAQGQRTSITIRLEDESDEPDEPNNPNEPDTPGEPNNPDPSEPDLRRCEGVVTITTQEQLETLTNCAIIQHVLTIDPTEVSTLRDVPGDSPITSLEPLRNLEEARFLIIRNVPTLTSLEGLTSFSRGSLNLMNNVTLSSLEGIDSFVAGTIRLEQNPSLTSLAGLEQVEAGSIEIRSNNGLTSLSGLSKLTEGGLNIMDNAALQSLDGLDNLERGTLNLSDNPRLTSLGSLDKLVELNSLSLQNNDALLSLEGLNNVTSIRFLTLVDNDVLASLDALKSVSSLGGITIRDSNAFASLQGLENVTALDFLEILSTTKLESLNGLENVASVGTNDAPYNKGVVIVGNQALTSLAGLDKLRTIRSRLSIVDNSALTSLAELNNLRRMQSSLEILGNVALPSLIGLENVESIGGNLIVLDNPELTSLTALSSLVNADIAGESTINNNENLDCPAQNLQFAPEMSQDNLVDCVLRSELTPQVTSFTATPNSIEAGQLVTLAWDVFASAEPVEVEISPELGSVAASGSATVSPSQSDTYTLTATNTYGTTSQGVTVTVGTSQTQVCEGDIDVTTQAEVDALRECSSITGNLLIKEAQEGTIFSLRALENLERIEGGLTIGGVNIDVFPYISANSELSSLEGLDNLEFVGGNLFIGGNRLLTSLEGLNKLSRVGGNVTIGAITLVPGPLASLDNFTLSNDSLTSLSGLEGLRSIGRSLSITANYSLTSLSGLEGLRSIPGNLHISNASLTSLEGLDNIVFISQNVDIWTGDGALTSLAALNNLTSIGGSLTIDFYRHGTGASTPSSFTSLEGLNNLTSIGTDLRLGVTINSLAPLAKLETVENVYLYDTALTNLTGLENVSSLSTLELLRNKSLTFTTGLTALNSVETFKVSGNGVLNSLQGFDSLTSIGRLEITDEPALAAVAGMQNLASVNDFILVNTGLGSLAPLNNVNVTNHLAIDKSQLSSLAGLEGTVELGVNLIITNNPRLTSLTGLNNLVIVSSETPLFRPELYAGSFFIRNNNALVSLEGLEKLEQVRGPVYVLGNASLTSIEQLTGIQDYNDSVYEVTVANNPNFDCTPPPILPFIVDVSSGNLIDCPTP
jgi:hypothetical protein